MLENEINNRQKLHGSPNCEYISNSCIKLECGVYKYSGIHDIGEFVKRVLGLKEIYIHYIRYIFFYSVRWATFEKFVIFDLVLT